MAEKVEKVKKVKKSEKGREKEVVRKKKAAVVEAKEEAVQAPPTAQVEVEVPKVVAAPVVETKPKLALPSGPRYYGTGRRKEAVAKVWLVPGSGRILVNEKNFLDYFCNRKLLEYQVTRPLCVAQALGKYDVFAWTEGGGIPGQAGAVSLGIARALAQVNPDWKVILRKEGLLTRDPRMKERKKYGRKRARRSFQYTKR
jgi:small subunit ribosomal protein S9